MSAADFLEKIGIAYPIIQGPMGGGPSTPELVAAVSNAGGMGSLGAAYMVPEKIISDIRKIKALTIRPFNVNLFVGTKRMLSRSAADAGYIGRNSSASENRPACFAFAGA